MHGKSLYPATRVFIALSFLMLAFGLPLVYRAITVFLGWLIAWMVKPLPFKDPGRSFLRLWLTAGLFLTIIHCISFDGKMVFNQEGLQIAGVSFFRIGALMASFLWIVRTMKAEEFYSILIDLRLPIPIIYVIFQALYLVPIIGERGNEILLAQQARGFSLKGIFNRSKAFILILSPLFSSMLYELEERAASITARGLYAQGRKSHLTEIQLTSCDIALIVVSVVITTIILMIVK